MRGPGAARPGAGPRPAAQGVCGVAVTIAAPVVRSLDTVLGDDDAAAPPSFAARQLSRQSCQLRPDGAFCGRRRRWQRASGPPPAVRQRRPCGGGAPGPRGTRARVI